MKLPGKAQKDAKAQPGKTKSGKAKAGQQKSSSQSLVLFGLIALIIAGAGLAVVFVGVQTSIANQQRAFMQVHADAAATAMAGVVAEHVRGVNARLQGVAQQDGIKSRVAGLGADGVALTEYQSLFPEASRLLLLPAGYARTDLESDPPVGYALLDMLRTAEKTGKPVPIESHQPYLNTVHPVMVNEQVAAHIVLTYPVSALQSLTRNAPGGRFEILQRAGGGVALVQAGSGGDITSRQPIAGTQWEVAFSPVPVRANLPFMALAAIAVAAALLLAAVVFLLSMAKKAALADGRMLAKMMRDLHEGRLQLEYPPSLKESRPVFAEAIKEARAVEEQLDRASQMSVSGGAKPTGRASFGEEREHMESRAGLEVVDNANLYGEEDEVTPVDVAEEASPEHASVFETVEPTKPEEIEPLEFDTSPGGVSIPRSILRAYDVRGVVGKDFTPEVARALAQALGSEAAKHGQQEVVLARDGRLSSEEIAEAVAEGLIAAGRTVINIGVAPTPLMNFATFHLRTAAGVMVTGSHNPPEYNGLKMVVGGTTLSGAAIQALGKRAEAGDFVEGEGKMVREDVLQEYIDRIAQDVTLHRPLRVVVDCGNGAASEVAPQLFQAMGCEVEELFCEIDGHFPNHHPDPTVPENLDALISYVRLQQADLGIAFDGDGDRLGIVDSSGKIIWADRQMMAFAQDVLSRQPGAEIIFDVKCSGELARVITDNGGVPVMWKTGHSLIKAKLKEANSPLAGEMSGHIFFADRWYGFDDGMYAAARLMEILAQDGRSSEEFFAALPEAVSTPEIRIDLNEGEATAMMKTLAARAAQAFSEARIANIDGIRADFADGWGLVRASNTQPALVLRFEAKDEKSLDRIRSLFKKHLLALRSDLSLPF